MSFHRLKFQCDNVEAQHEKTSRYESHRDIDSKALEAAKQLAAQRKVMLDAIVSELILKALRAEVPVLRRNGFPVFLATTGKLITLDGVKHAEVAA